MAERASALAHLPPGAADAGSTLSEVRPGWIVQVAAWPDSDARAQAAIARLLGVLVPRVGEGVVERGFTLLATAPGRFLAAGGGEDIPARLEAALPAADGAVTDLSHGRVILRLDGAKAPDVLAHCVAIDLDPSVFPPGRVAQTMIHHVDVVLHRTAASTFDLWVLRSFAEALAEWVLDAGLPHGLAFRPA